jgi:ABC-type nitrate/sulfonate/bicarbonate transport system substrate-binding protein
MKTTFSRTIFVTFVICSVVLVLSTDAQDKPLKKIYWGVTSISASDWIPWLAKEAKIYEKNGLDVELILLRGSGQTSTAILGGADLVNVAHMVPGVQSRLLVKPEIKSPEDLKGKRIATSSLSSLGDFLFR